MERTGRVSFLHVTSGCGPLFVSWLGEPDSRRRRRPGPKTVEGCSHVGSCPGDQQGFPQRCGAEEKEGTRRPGHGLPGHLQRCYDSGVCSVSPRANAAVVECVCCWARLNNTVTSFIVCLLYAAKSANVLCSEITCLQTSVGLHRLTAADKQAGCSVTVTPCIQY